MPFLFHGHFKMKKCSLVLLSLIVVWCISFSCCGGLRSTHAVSWSTAKLYHFSTLVLICWNNLLGGSHRVWSLPDLHLTNCWLGGSSQENNCIVTVLFVDWWEPSNQPNETPTPCNIIISLAHAAVAVSTFTWCVRQKWRGPPQSSPRAPGTMLHGAECTQVKKVADTPTPLLLQMCFCSKTFETTADGSSGFVSVSATLV